MAIMSPLVQQLVALIPEALFSACLLVRGVTIPALRLYVGYCLLARWAARTIFLKV